MQADSQPPENPVADALRNALQRQRTAYLAHPVPSLAERRADRAQQSRSRLSTCHFIAPDACLPAAARCAARSGSQLRDSARRELRLRRRLLRWRAALGCCRCYVRRTPRPPRPVWRRPARALMRCGLTRRLVYAFPFRRYLLPPRVKMTGRMCIAHGLRPNSSRKKSFCFRPASLPYFEDV